MAAIITRVAIILHYIITNNTLGFILSVRGHLMLMSMLRGNCCYPKSWASRNKIQRA